MRSGDFKETYGELVALTDSPPVWLWSVVLIVALILAPYLLNSYALSFLMIVLITVVGALGLNILTGYTGLISLGHVGFLVTGAYAYAVVVSKYGLPPLVGFLAAGIVPALASLVVGAPSLRLKGLYLAITTLAFSFIINTVILEARTLTNGARGISVQRPEILGVSFDSDAAFTHLCLGFAILTLFATLNIRRSRVGRAFVAIRDNDTAARVMGINLHAYKLFAVRHQRIHYRHRRRVVWHLSLLCQRRGFPVFAKHRGACDTDRWRPRFGARCGPGNDPDCAAAGGHAARV
jgi:branched-chain amino acid transport system permease protein